MRADLLLVQRGIAASRDRARVMIESGVVLVDGVAMTRPARRIAANADITTTRPDMAWVSRAALKLVGGLDAFPQIDPKDRICVDIGASTGGFTEVLLARGARHVVAVDVGRDQLHPRLAGDRASSHAKGSMPAIWLRPISRSRRSSSSAMPPSSR